MIRGRGSVVVVGGLLGACAPEPVTVELAFPSVSHLVATDSAEVIAFARDGDTACPRLVQDALTDLVPRMGRASSTERHAVCSFRRGGRTLEGLEEGDYDLLAVARSQAGLPLFAGCTPVAITFERATVEVLVAAPSAEGQSSLARAAQIACDGIDERCAGGCR